MEPPRKWLKRPTPSGVGVSFVRQWPRKELAPPSDAYFSAIAPWTLQSGFGSGSGSGFGGTSTSVPGPPSFPFGGSVIGEPQAMRKGSTATERHQRMQTSRRTLGVGEGPLRGKERAVECL